VRKRQPGANPGDEVDWEVTPANFGRIAAQTAKQAILLRLRQAEKVRTSEEYKDKLLQLVTGVVRRVERGEVYIDFQRAEGVMRHSERIPGEEYAVGDHLTAILIEVNADKPGPCLIVSRAHPDFVKNLFEREVSEMGDSLVTIRAVAREPGFRTKIAVDTTDPRVDPVGACVGMRGNRVKTIVRELGGEKVDIIRWDPDVRTFVTNALQPAKLSGVEVDQVAQVVRVTVPEDQLSLAIGKRGQNARLAAKLTGWKIDINRQEKPPEQLGFEDKVQRAIQALADIDGIGLETAGKLVRNGFSTLEGILAAEVEDLTAIDGIDLGRAQEIMTTAKRYMGA
jgi:N utilization substance protein A